MGVDGRAAARILLANGAIRGGYCLYYVWLAYKAAGARTSRGAGTALEGWEKSDGKHWGDRNPPAGVPVWFGAKPSSDAGDVVISLGDGRVACTDWPRYGVVGTCTIDERQRQIGRPYLGWTERIFDQAIDYANAPAPAGGGNATPIPKPPTEEEQIMGVADDITNKLGSKIDGLDTRRDTAVVEVEGNFYVVDHAQGTKWNAIRGQNSVEDAFKFIGWLRDLGIARYDRQAPFTLAGYEDITNQDISAEIAAGVRAGVASAATLAITLTKEQIDQLSAALAARIADSASEESVVASAEDVRHALVALPFVTEAA